MIKFLIAFFLLIGFSASISISSFKQISVNHEGKGFQTRNLETSFSEIQKIPFKVYHSAYACSYAVEVNLGQSYLSTNNISTNSSTDMLIILHSNTTSFCANCSSFADYHCQNDSCAAGENQSVSISSPFMNISKGIPVKHSLSIGKDLEVWTLNTPAVYFTQESTTLKYYGQNKTLYGLLGLGVDGDAKNNFKQKNGTLFSIKIDLAETQGQLIFGNDTTQYNNTDKPVIFPTSGNWSAEVSALFLGDITREVFTSTIIFDLQREGISFPFKYFSVDKLWWESFRNKYNFSFDAFATYPFSFTGEISALPPLQLNLTSGVSLTIPPCAYTKHQGNKTYQILMNGLDDDQHQNIVFGWHVLGHYYSVFHLNETGSPYVSMHPIIFDEEELSYVRQDYTLLYILFVGTILIAIASAISHCLKRARRRGPGEVGLELKGSLDGLNRIKPVQFD